MFAGDCSAIEMNMFVLNLYFIFKVKITSFTHRVLMAQKFMEEQCPNCPATISTSDDVPSLHTITRHKNIQFSFSKNTVYYSTCFVESNGRL